MQLTILAGPNKLQQRLRAAWDMLSAFVDRMDQRKFQRLWQRYKQLVDLGDVSRSEAFWEEFKGQGHPRYWALLLTALGKLLELEYCSRSCDGGAPLELLQRCWDLVGALVGRQSGSDNDDLPRSL